MCELLVPILLMREVLVPIFLHVRGISTNSTHVR